jgi:hypothetical protein
MPFQCGSYNTTEQIMTAQQPPLFDLKMCLEKEAECKQMSADASLTVEQRALHAEQAEQWARLAKKAEIQ